MKYVLLTSLFVATLCGQTLAFAGYGRPAESSAPKPGAEVGKPLFLTPLIESGQIDLAVNLSRVIAPGTKSGVVSYSGYLTVNKTANSNLFFWFFPAGGKYHVDNDAPVLLWLQGGPGSSSLFAIFSENGPFIVNDPAGESLRLRNCSWTWKYNVIYVDNPVGTGYSFTDDATAYAKNQVDVGRDLFEALQQFFTLFPRLQGNPFYATGESYGGKYVPAIGYKILTEGSQALMNFKGVIIGDGLSDPETQVVGYGQLLYQIGIIDQNELEHFESEQQRAVKLIRAKDFKGAFVVFDSLLNGDLVPYPAYFKNVTGSSNYYNFLLTSEPEDMSWFGAYVTRDETRAAIHVGNKTYNDGKAVENNLMSDVMDSVKPWLEVLIEKSRVLLYSGQLDIIVGAPLTEAMIATFNWTGAAAYQASQKKIWRLSPDAKDVAGYWKSYKNFHYVVVRNAGHMVPYDQPEAALAMIDTFIADGY